MLPVSVVSPLYSSPSIIGLCSNGKEDNTIPVFNFSRHLTFESVTGSVLSNRLFMEWHFAVLNA